MWARCSALEGGLAKATHEHIATSGYGSCVVLLRRGRGRRVAVRDVAKLQKTTPAPTVANQAKPSQAKPSQAKPSQAKHVTGPCTSTGY